MVPLLHFPLAPQRFAGFCEVVACVHHHPIALPEQSANMLFGRLGCCFLCQVPILGTGPVASLFTVFRTPALRRARCGSNQTGGCSIGRPRP
eukprot:6492379-Amphidinium_carterae.1